MVNPGAEAVRFGVRAKPATRAPASGGGLFARIARRMRARTPIQPPAWVPQVRAMSLGDGATVGIGIEAVGVNAFDFVVPAGGSGPVAVFPQWPVEASGPAVFLREPQ